jgi:Family of unknown function (DUF6644)
MAEFMMPVRNVFEYVSNLQQSIDLRESQYVWSLFEVAHVISMCLFAGLIIMMDLRLLGIGNMQTPFSTLQKRLFPWQMLGMALSAITGLILVFGDPMRFYANIFFWMKMSLMAIAALNAMAFHYITYFDVNTWDNKVPPYGAKLSGALGLGLWAFVIVSGRLIPYNWFQ